MIIENVGEYSENICLERLLLFLFFVRFAGLFRVAIASSL